MTDANNMICHLNAIIPQLLNKYDPLKISKKRKINESPWLTSERNEKSYVGAGPRF